MVVLVSLPGGGYRAVVKGDPKAQPASRWQGLLPLGLAAGLVLAETTPVGAGARELVMKAFNPVIDLVKGLAYPVASLSILGGMLLVTTGNRHKGLEMVKYGALGYLGVQFAPAIMAMLGEVADAMQSSPATASP